MLAWCYAIPPHLPSVRASLHTAVDFLFTHHMLLRSEGRREIDLADLWCLPLDNEGPTPCMAFVLLRDHGKTNTASRVEYSAAMRHRNPLVCLLFNLSAYLMYMWEVERVPPPNFQRRRTWYYYKLFPGGSNDGLVSYDTLRVRTRQLLDAGGLTAVQKSTHLARAEGAKFVDMPNVTLAGFPYTL